MFSYECSGKTCVAVALQAGLWDWHSGSKAMLLSTALLSFFTALPLSPLHSPLPYLCHILYPLSFFFVIISSYVHSFELFH